MLWEEGDALLNKEETKWYHSLTMRIGYISHDRCDLQRVVGELAHPIERFFLMSTRAGTHPFAGDRLRLLRPA